MLNITGNQTSASYNETNQLAGEILKALAGREASIGYGLLACALTMCRLMNTGKKLSDEVEIAFIQSMMEWSNAYFVPEGKGN